MTTDVFSSGRGAVITGGASGIGLAVAHRLVSEGMRVCIADVDAQALDKALAELTAHQAGEAMAVVTDVADFESVCAMRDQAVGAFGDIAFVMNNAGMGGQNTSFEGLETWQKTLGVNLWGIVHGVHAFVPHLLAQATPAVVVNTGSKQGITNPPGNPAYNVSKAGVRSLTESLAHELRNIENCQVSAHLLVPGFTYTGMIRRFVKEKPPAAWTPEQVADYLLERLKASDFYILCPDNDVSVELDHKRLLWNANDIVENRPALSRWHPDYTDDFEAYVK